MSDSTQLIGILGGTFDPIHMGHCRIALECQQAFGLDHVRFVPAKQPVHRDTPNATPEQRLTMLSLAIADEPSFIVDDTELRRTTPSFIHTTLQQLQLQFGEDAHLCLIMGMDAFANLPTWHRWQDLLHQAHIIVAHRPHIHKPTHPELKELLDKALISKPEALYQQRAGCIAMQSVTGLDISASKIRSLIAHTQAHSARYLCPDSVLKYIAEQDLYRL